MKKLLAILLTVLLMLSVSIPAFAEEMQAEVYVTIADANGALALAQEKITVTDTDGDGILSVNDALYAAHEAGFDGGAAAGYAAVRSEYGLSLMKLWGTENGGSYGYYINDASPLSLLDPVQNGDYVAAFVYTDLTAWSDTYCFFDVRTLSGKAGDTVTLTLSAAGYDADFNPVTLPVEGAEITLNGEGTGVLTDKDGKATLTLVESGILSATSESATLVPPVCVATVEKDADEQPESTPSADNETVRPESTTQADTNNPKTGDAPIGMAVMALAAAGGCLLCIGKKHHEDR